MCGIAGFCNFNKNYMTEQQKWTQVLENMQTRLIRRGPDDSGTFLNEHIALDRKSVV